MNGLNVNMHITIWENIPPNAWKWSELLAWKLNQENIPNDRPAPNQIQNQSFGERIWWVCLFPVIKCISNYVVYITSEAKAH